MKININPDKLLKLITNFIIGSLDAIVKTLLVLMIASGWAASVILLYKMYPVIGLELMSKFLIAIKILQFVIKAILLITAIAGVLYSVLKTLSIFEDSKKNRIKKREEFLDDLADKLTKRGIKNVQKQPKK